MKRIGGEQQEFRMRPGTRYEMKGKASWGRDRKVESRRASRAQGDFFLFSILDACGFPFQNNFSYARNAQCAMIWHLSTFPCAKTKKIASPEPKLTD
jgi:hypothetical protein